MAPPRNRLLSTLAILASLALIAIAPATSSASVRHHRTAHTVHSRAACAVRARRARTAVRGCHTAAHKARHIRQAKPHKATRETPVGNRAAVRESTAEESAAKIAAVLATPCQDTELTPEAGNIALVRAAVLCLINQERAQNGRGPLTLNAHLENAAEGHCAELVADDYFAHISPSGETPVQRIAATGYIPGPSTGYAIGENLAWGTLSLATPKSIVAAWIASPGHLANILESQYTETGIGVTPAVPASLGEGEPGASYAQEFGVILP